MMAVLLTVALLVLLVVGLVAAVVGYVFARSRESRVRSDALAALARSQGIEVAVKVGLALGWIEDVRQVEDRVQIRTR